MPKTIQWWEKSVEYLFVLNHLSGDSVIAPLDGDHERAGDAILSQEDKWLVIEFKHSRNSLSDEKRKYDDYNAAKGALMGRDGSHLLVYGEEVKGKLTLEAVTYFCGTKVKIADYIKQATDFKTFTAYVTTLVSYKKNPRGSTASSSNDGGFGNVAVVGKVVKDGQVECMTFAEFRAHFEIELLIGCHPKSPDIDVL